MSPPGRNLKLTIAYDGTGYHGWQIQPKLPTVQAKINQAATRIIGEVVSVIGAGRTDTGVHATGQVANFVTNSQMPITTVQKALNANLPPDIAILDVEEVSADFHARFSAIRRRYKYTILNRSPCPFRRHTAFFVPKPICLQKSQAICNALCGQRNFASFQKTGSNRPRPVCHIFDASLQKENDVIIFCIEADAFLRGMVRAIMGTILAVHHLPDPAGEIQRIIAAQDRSTAGTSVPAKGLALTAVEYPSQP